ncbi:hypothetical protein [Streptomonospora wellingtoniae]|uniref:Uncharacterized protein n=1 Tax=Streptomonospora wellingtoniae TaxID=3075544 RepID=A0ABU2KQM1_9ACTN|nr:hypothetical protein [Streptomonospora sp. DSM 45055]MDT0301511.1 hypothetical protein [Streptomonospora sp. DSM 45055]
MITSYEAGSFAVSGEFVAKSWDTVRNGAACGQPRPVGVQGVSSASARLTRPGMQRGHGYALLARTADISRQESEFAAATQRPKGVVGECPRGIPA